MTTKYIIGYLYITHIKILIFFSFRFSLNRNYITVQVTLYFLSMEVVFKLFFNVLKNKNKNDRDPNKFRQQIENIINYNNWIEQ